MLRDQIGPACKYPSIDTDCGTHFQYTKSLIDPTKGDAIFDHNEGPEKVVMGIDDVLHRNGLERKDMLHVFNVINERGSWAAGC
jgi:hypothetical protein